jgi:hypothetical protein
MEVMEEKIETYFYLIKYKMIEKNKEKHWQLNMD